MEGTWRDRRGHVGMGGTRRKRKGHGGTGGDMGDKVGEDMGGQGGNGDRRGCGGTGGDIEDRRGHKRQGRTLGTGGDQGTGRDMGDWEGTWDSVEGLGDGKGTGGDMGDRRGHERTTKPSVRQQVTRGHRAVGACRAPGLGWDVRASVSPPSPASRPHPAQWGDRRAVGGPSHRGAGVSRPRGWPMGVPVVPPCWAARSGAGSRSSGRVRPGTCTRRTGCPRP